MNDNFPQNELPDIRHANSLKTVCVSGVSVQRDLIIVGKVPVVLFRKHQPLLHPRFDSAAWEQFRAATSLPIRLQEELAHWNRIQRFRFNCHMLSVGSQLGMHPTAWLEGSSSRLTLLSNPVEDLLKKYFDLVGGDLSESELATCGQDDDVIVFRKRESWDIVHSARVRQVGGRLLLLSKFGEDPACVTTLQRTADTYAGEFDCIEVYRCNVACAVELLDEDGFLRRFDCGAQSVAGGRDVNRISRVVAHSD